MRPVIRQGRFRATSSRYGFVRPTDEASGDFFVPARFVAGALDGDLVSFEVAYEDPAGPHAEARIVAILQRRHAHLTGEITGTRRHPVFVPDPPRLPARLPILGIPGHALPGDRVVATLIERPGSELPGVRVIERLGDAGDPRLDADIIAAEFALPGPYPADALEEAARVAAALAGRDWSGRRDFSDELTFTIDPIDAQDHDDAVAIARTPDGGYRLRVHIADVAEAVCANGAVDREARRRGNSTYLPGHMIPMLPEMFARDLMSLRAGERRPVITLSMRVASDGALAATRIEEGLIVSRVALDYERVQRVLDRGERIAPDIDGALQAMAQLAQALRKRRFARGGFDLRVPETEVALDPGGLPLTIGRRLPWPSTQLIEEFMILANRVACDYALRHGHPYLMRVHEPPDPRALDLFRAQVPLLAPGVSPSRLRTLAELRVWLAGLPSEPRTWQIHGLFLRALKRAVYAPEDRGHFGLGLRGYAHFTSPIRRYPDLFNHRVVKWTLRHGTRVSPPEWRDMAGVIALECTESDERSERAEREMIRIKSVRWAAARLGEVFAGRVVAAQPGGVFVEFDDVPVEGWLPREDFPSRRHEPHRRRRHDDRRTLSFEPDLGMPLRVRIARVDPRARRIHLAPETPAALLPGERATGGAAPGAGARRGRGADRGGRGHERAAGRGRDHGRGRGRGRGRRQGRAR
jgi:ribonuclease R